MCAWMWLNGMFYGHVSQRWTFWHTANALRSLYSVAADQTWKCVQRCLATLAQGTAEAPLPRFTEETVRLATPAPTNHSVVGGRGTADWSGGEQAAQAFCSDCMGAWASPVLQIQDYNTTPNLSLVSKVKQCERMWQLLHVATHQRYPQHWSVA